MAGPSTFWAPVHRLLGRIPPGSGASAFPPNASPSITFLGDGLQDHRLPYNLFNSQLGTTGAGALGWYTGDAMVANFSPATAATGNIVTAANPTSGTAMTLRAASGAGIVVLSATAPALLMPGMLMAQPASNFNIPGGSNPAGLNAGCVIDTIPTYQRFGSSGSFTSVFFNRQTCVGRCVSVTGVASGSGGNVAISGYDVYGYPMTQTVTLAAGANTVNTTKAFKIVTSVVPAFTDTHTVAVGTADIFGLGILAQYWGDLSVFWNSAGVTASTGFVTADQTSPATATTGDVRGTYAVQSASDGTKRLQIYVTPSLSLLIANPTTGLFGQPQV